MAPQRCKVPISIVAVNHIKVTDLIDWLYMELSIYVGGFEPFISLDADILAQSNSFDLPMCENEQVVIVTHQNVQFEGVSFFKEASDEEKFLLFQHGKINGK